ncbi:MAG: hypothetical protein IIX95_05840 [Clostridiales bacterium]|nr:hypothetical protein [Clostridiales bacterium]
MGAAFVTLAELEVFTGARYEDDDLMRAEAILPLVSDLIRVEGRKYGIDVDERIGADSAYESVVKMITCDVVSRALRQSKTGDPLSQESQSALGYSWSGTYAVPGGGISGAIMRNDLKRLGLRRQRIGVYEIWDASQDEA